MTNLLATLSFSILSVAGSVAVAAESVEHSNELWESLDTDTDSYITQVEAVKSPVIVDNWDKIDTSGDSAISAEEFAAFFAAPVVKTKTEIDTEKK